MTELIPNAALAYRVLDVINANPVHFDMDNWVRAPHDQPMIGLEQLTGPECGTTACFAGWTVALSGYQLTPDLKIVNANRVVPEKISTLAAQLLGLSEDQADELFYVGNEDFSPALVAEIFGPRPAELTQQRAVCGRLVEDCRCDPMGHAYDDVPPNAGSAS